MESFSADPPLVLIVGWLVMVLLAVLLLVRLLMWLLPKMKAQGSAQVSEGRGAEDRLARLAALKEHGL
jgi:hypothetical protein